jgi:hypothetical protein
MRIRKVIFCSLKRGVAVFRMIDEDVQSEDACSHTINLEGTENTELEICDFGGFFC